MFSTDIAWGQMRCSEWVDGHIKGLLLSGVCWLYMQLLLIYVCVNPSCIILASRRGSPVFSENTCWCSGKGMKTEITVTVFWTQNKDMHVFCMHPLKRSNAYLWPLFQSFVEVKWSSNSHEKCVFCFPVLLIILLIILHSFRLSAKPNSNITNIKRFESTY